MQQATLCLHTSCHCVRVTFPFCTISDIALTHSKKHCVLSQAGCPVKEKVTLALGTPTRTSWLTQRLILIRRANFIT